MKQRNFWTLNKLIVLLALGAFAMLLLEIRYTHRNVLGEEPLSWTPLVYSTLMLLAGIAALLLWERGGRKVLFWCFAAGLVIGPLGLWLHTIRHPARGLKRELSAWSLPISGGEKRDQQKGGEQAALEKPPVLAPLTFFGLGLLGMLACAARFQPLVEEKRTP